MIDVNDGVDSTEDHIKAAKAYLLKASSRSGQTMYVLLLLCHGCHASYTSLFDEPVLPLNNIIFLVIVTLNVFHITANVYSCICIKV